MAFDGLISRTIGSVINGISQQPSAIRLKSQAERQINCLSDVVGGVSRRPGTKHVIGPNTGTWPSAMPTGGVFVHPINRGSGEQFICIIEDKDINVFNLAGTEMTVTDNGAAGVPTNYTYLDYDTATYTAKEAFAAVTIADYTFIVNKTKTVAMSGNTGASSTVTRTQAHEFLIWAGAPATDVVVDLNIGGAIASGTSGAAGAFDSPTIMNEIWTALGCAGTSGTDVLGTGSFANWKFTKTSKSNWLYGYQFQNALEAVFVNDDFGDTVGKIATTSTAGDDAFVAKFSDLPKIAHDGFLVKVGGSDGNDADDFYVKFEAVGGDNEGLWRETTASGLDNEFDADTMPHTLTYQGGTTFWFQPGTWDDRTKGDAVSAPEPTFVGREIKDILLHKSRLTVLADENVMGTESHNYFNFWPTTATTIVDSDPIDVSAGGNEVNLLEFAVPFQRNLTVFSPTGGTQQELVGSDVEDLTIKNARIEERTHYQMAPVRPVSAGKNLYFAVERNEWSALHEYGMDGLDRAFTEDAAAHVPSFVPKNINRISGSSAENVIALSTTEADFDHRLYIYRFWYIGDQKVQSSWSYWEFDSAAKVDDHFWIDSTLYIVLERADGPHLEKIDFRETESLDYDGNGIGYLVHLDKHAVVTLAYSAVGDYSSYSCGFDPTDIANEEDYGEWVLVKVRGGLSLEWPEGEIGEVIVPTVDATTTNGSLRFEGDLTGGSYILGMRYRSKYQVSEVVIDEGSDERPRPLLSGHILLKRWRVLYKDTMDFDVEVTFTDGDDSYTYSFSQDQVGDIDAEPLPVSGEYAFPVGARSEHAEITFTSESPGPFTFTAMEWEARLFSRARRA